MLLIHYVRTGGREGQGCFLAQVDQLFDALGGHLVVDHQQIGRGGHQTHRHKIAHHVVRHLGVERAIDRVRAHRAHHQGMAIRRGLGHKVCANVAP